ncbi:phosphocholine-specific phospholipase C [Zavarzinia sp.]|uniref:phosphocholine-specific phospholipase C n=1 Tax=Zavarzinia sp. TaxID=2027920 RepID=UPI00356A1188
MTGENRRDFLKKAGLLAGGGAAAAAFPAAIRNALAIDANNATKSIKDVQHIVVLMQENRAFDHYFGTFPGVRGFADRFTVPHPADRTVFQQWNGSRYIMPYHLDQSKGNAQRVTGTPHGWSDTHSTWDQGRISNWTLYKEDQSMGYYTEAEIPFQRALASAFTLCDNYHCSVLSGTNPNRLFHMTGTNGPTGNGSALVLNDLYTTLMGPSSQGYDWTTYPERLQAAGVSWKVYQNMPDNGGLNVLVGFRQYRKASEGVGNSPLDGLPWWPWIEAMDKKQPLYKGAGNTMPDGGMLTALKRDVKNGKLPQVSWIIPESFYCEHPSSSSPIQGGWYMQRVLEILTSDPDTWSKTVFIVNFDENDGFFDHVPPPVVPSRNADGSLAGATTMKEADLSAEYFTHPAPADYHSQPAPDGQPYGPGPRVPCLVISPWSRGGWVASETFDHTSVLRFIEARFGVHEPNIAPYRRTVCGDLTSCFDFVTPNTAVPDLPTRTKIAVDALRMSQALRSQVAIPDEAAQAMPEVEARIRPSRPLPYELHVDSRPTVTGMQLVFRNTGRAAAVFHVFDQLHLDRVPRRYMVEAGKSLSATWDAVADHMAYDLWILGPNSYHRRVSGSIAVAGLKGRTNPKAILTYDRAGRNVVLTLTNTGITACRLSVTANAYESFSTTVDLAAGGRQALTRAVGIQGNWYDYTVALKGEETGFARRFAGRMETGQNGISDPAAVLAQIAAVD